MYLSTYCFRAASLRLPDTAGEHRFLGLCSLQAQQTPNTGYDTVIMSKGPHQAASLFLVRKQLHALTPPQTINYRFLELCTCVWLERTWYKKIIISKLKRCLDRGTVAFSPCCCHARANTVNGENRRRCRHRMLSRGGSTNLLGKRSQWTKKAYGDGEAGERSNPK